MQRSSIMLLLSGATKKSPRRDYVSSGCLLYVVRMSEWAWPGSGQSNTSDRWVMTSAINPDSIRLLGVALMALCRSVKCAFRHCVEFRYNTNIAPYVKIVIVLCWTPCGGSCNDCRSLVMKLATRISENNFQNALTFFHSIFPLLSPQCVYQTAFRNYTLK